MKWFLLLLLLSFNVAADYTICWVPPTENTDNTPLTDLDGYNLWAIPVSRTYGGPQVFPVTPAGTCAENRGPEDCHFEEDGKMCYHKYWPSPAGDWKARMSAFNTSGVESAYSAEIFFTLIDIDGDGNPSVDDGTVPDITFPPDAPDPIIVECPEIVGECPEIARNYTMTVTRKGLHTITGPDGLLLLKADGSERRVTTRDEAYEWISSDGRLGIFIITPPTYEVEWK